MPIFSKSKKSVLFIHIPKAAGTTIEDAFVEAGFEMSYRRGGKCGDLNEFDKANGCSPQHLHSELLEKWLSHRRFDLCFTVVRHPFSRMVSEYKFRTESGNKFALGKELESFAIDALVQFRKNPMFLDNHIRPQVDFLWRSCEVIKLEDGLDTLSTLIKATIGEDITFRSSPKMRSKNRKELAVMGNLSDTLKKFYSEDFERFGYE